MVNISKEGIWDLIVKIGGFSKDITDKLINYIITKFPKVTTKQISAITLLVYLIILYILFFKLGLKKWLKVVIILLFIYLMAGLFLWQEK